MQYAITYKYIHRNKSGKAPLLDLSSRLTLDVSLHGNEFRLSLPPPRLDILFEECNASVAMKSFPSPLPPFVEHQWDDDL